MKFLTPRANKRMADLASSPYRPPQILKLKEEIEFKTRALELKSSVSGKVSQEEINDIVRMKLELDRLYARWVEGEIE